MADIVRRTLRPFKYKFGRLAARIIHGSLGLTALLVRVAQKNGFDIGSKWRQEFQTPFQTFAPRPFSIQDLFMLTGPPADLPVVSDGSTEIISSIIIPVFNKAEYTFQCLRALLGEVDLKRHEIIIVNNASTDETSRLLSHFADKLNVLNNSENEGFVDACNRGARSARGRFLIFLNNDTLVQPGWLKYLIDTIDADPSVGAVGSMLIYPDGRLQEAGGIVWSDGNAHHYGHSMYPGDYKFNYVREVDYCSGASLLVRKDLFDQLGGFDQRYAPAYYEDTDLCMGIRSIGFKVVYQPFSRVVHYEGITAGKDIQSGLKRFQPINRVKFVEKWSEVLNADHLRPDVENIERAANRKAGAHFLVCDETIPITNRDAGSARMFEILKILSRHGQVTFTPLNILDEPGHLQKLYEIGVRIVHNSDLRSVWRAERFDTAIVSRPNVANEFIGLIRRHSPLTKIIYDTVDIYFVRFGREFAVTKDGEAQKRSNQFRRLEARLAGKCDQVWCVTDKDRDALSSVSPGARIRLVPNVHASHKGNVPFSKRSGLLFLGSFGHEPNVDAMLYYNQEILPHLKELLPGVGLHIVGSNPTGAIRELNSENITVHGFVDDLGPLMNSCRVFICPLRFGAGLKGKIGEALSYGLPVVTTTIGAEGFGLTDGRDAMIADGPAEFAARVVTLYQDEKLWNTLATNGGQFIKSHFSAAVVEREVIKALDELGIKSGKSIT